MDNEPKRRADNQFLRTWNFQQNLKHWANGELNIEGNLYPLYNELEAAIHIKIQKVKRTSHVEGMDGISKARAWWKQTTTWNTLELIRGSRHPNVTKLKCECRYFGENTSSNDESISIQGSNTALGMDLLVLSIDVDGRSPKYLAGSGLHAILGTGSN